MSVNRLDLLLILTLCGLIGEEKKATLEREMTIIKEKMSVIEADSGYLKNTTMTLQQGDERADLFTEIAQNLRRLRT